MATVQEALIILYTRGVTDGNTWIVVAVTGVLGLLGFVITRRVVMDDSNKSMTMAILGHMVGVPIGMLIPI